VNEEALAHWGSCAKRKRKNRVYIVHVHEKLDEKLTRTLKDKVVL
jgi:hypothetical protein